MEYMLILNRNNHINMSVTILNFTEAEGTLFLHETVKKRGTPWYFKLDVQLFRTLKVKLDKALTSDRIEIYEFKPKLCFGFTAI